MAIYNAEVNRISTGETVCLGRVANSGKMNMFRAMQSAGETVIGLFDDCGEFEFVWNKKSKCWEFFSEQGDLVGRLKAVRDTKAEYKKNLAYYNEATAALEALKKSGA